MTIYDQMNEQTKRLIKTSFLSLLTNKDFNKISIRDLTESAAINRGTFYLHFENKYDLLENIEQDLLYGLEKACMDLEPEEVLGEAREGRLCSIRILRCY